MSSELVLQQLTGRWVRLFILRRNSNRRGNVMKKHGLTLILALLMATASAPAQPWQWALYDGDFYNPSGFPGVSGGGMWNTYTSETTGNFDGVDADEFIRVDSGVVTLGVHQPGQGCRWTTLHLNQDLIAGNHATGAASVDLDNDLAEELIVFSDTISCWKATGTNPWTWQRRDDLLEALHFPPLTHNAIIGDYDGNGLLNEVIQAGDPINGLQLWERNAEGTWEMQSALLPSGWGGFYDGDFDHDGDLDFAIVAYLLDLDESASGFFENTGAGIVDRDFNLNLPGPQGGDMDGDGEWEALGVWGDSGCHLQEVEPDSPEFLQVVSQTALSRLNGQVLGNLHTPGGYTVVGVQNISQSFDLFYWCSSFIPRYRTSEQWVFDDNGFTHAIPFQTYRNLRASLADLDGDGLNDIFQQQVHLTESDSVEEWWVWRNTGSAEADAFGQSYPLPRFTASSDTSFASPQIGDITSDGRAELGMIVGIGDQPPRVMFFELVGDIANTTFVLHPEWSNGLNAALDKIRLADIDNDGLAEIMGYSNGVWHSYFLRSALWQEYTNILPPVAAEDIAFADADNDGDLDLFTTDEVWLSLSPNSNDDSVAPLPVSFTLSAYPNPFNAVTTMSFSLPRNERLSLKLYDVLGREVEELFSGHFTAGDHTIRYSADHLGSGIYFARLETASAAFTQKLVILK